MKYALISIFPLALLSTFSFVACDLKKAGESDNTAFDDGTDSGMDCSAEAEVAATAQYDLAVNELRERSRKMVADTRNACAAVANALGKSVAESDPIQVACEAARVGVSESGAAIAVTPSPCLLPSEILTTCASAIDPTCDAKATPYVCEGGRLDITCHGRCDIEAAGASIECVGGGCEGVSSKLFGDRYTCAASCRPLEGEDSIVCNGKCTGAFELLGCRGGKWKGGCVDGAKESAYCSARSIAASECEAPVVETTSEALNSVKASLEVLARVKVDLGLNVYDSLVVLQANVTPCSAVEMITKDDVASAKLAAEGASAVFGL